MRALLFGFGASAAFAVGSVALMYLGLWLGLESWSPVFWPVLLFGITGSPFLELLDSVPLVNRFFAMFVRGDGTSGVFLVMGIYAFFVWWCIFSAVVHFWPQILTLTLRSSGTAQKRAAP